MKYQVSAKLNVEGEYKVREREWVEGKDWHSMCNVLLTKSKCINNKLSDDEKDQAKKMKQGQEKKKVDSWLTIEGLSVSTWSTLMVFSSIQA